MNPFLSLFLILFTFIGILYGAFNDLPFLAGVGFGGLLFQTIYYTVCGSFFNPPTEKGVLVDRLDSELEAETKAPALRLSQGPRPSHPKVY